MPTATLTPTTTASPLPTPSSTPPLPSQHRVYRCRRCADRKFRTPKDLALHILDKHGQTKYQSINPTTATAAVTLAVATATNEKHHKFNNTKTPSATINNKRYQSFSDDACSVTIISPIIESSPVPNTPKTITSDIHHAFKTKPFKRPRGTQHQTLLISKRPNNRMRTHTTVSTSHNHVTATDENVGRSRNFMTEARKSKNNGVRIPAVHEGESIGPVSQDVYVRKCLDGRIPLIPMHSQPAKTINFAQGLF